MSSLEDLLLESGAMTEAQVAIARDEQRIHGGSLDLNILALGFLTERAMQQLLAQRWDQVGKVDYTQDPTEGAIALLTARQAEEIGAVPQSKLGSQLYVLVHDPAAVDRLGELPELDELDIVPVGVNEVRLKMLLHRCYGIQPDPRVLEIMDRLASHSEAAAARRKAAADSLIGDPMAGLDEPWLAGAVVVDAPGDDLQEALPVGTSPLGEYGELREEDIPILEDELLIEVVDDDEGEDAAVDTTGRALEERKDALAAQDFQATLDALVGMDGLPEVFLRFGVPHFQSVALFKVQGGMLMGWRGAGLGIVPEMIRGIVVPTRSDTFLAKAIERSVHSSKGANNVVEERILEQLGCGEDASLVAASVKVGDRPVLVVAGASVGSEPDQEVLAELTHLCHLASQTVVRLIMERKKARAASAPEPEQEPEQEPQQEPEQEPQQEPEPEPEPQQKPEPEQEPEQEPEPEPQQEPESEPKPRTRSRAAPKSTRATRAKQSGRKGST